MSGGNSGMVFRVSINETRVPPSDFPDFSSAQIAANKNGLSC